MNKMSKWEDTVMSDEKILKAWNVNLGTFNKAGELNYSKARRAIAQAQAEISFEIGEAKGYSRGFEYGIKRCAKELGIEL